ncbi:MAG TPA: hypothetical protein VNG90_03575 [Candidatus Acidoferrum sp.]|nr:hypothetical protein [Candidatus Acidoferrum sp.]
MELQEFGNRRIVLWARQSGFVLLLAFVVATALWQPTQARAETTPAADSTTSYTVTAAIDPARVIIVNPSGIIQTILSNTRQVVEPTVHQGSYDGPAMAYTSGIRRQYMHILQTYQLAHVRGVVYVATVNPPALQGTPLLSWPTSLAMFAHSGF